MEEQTENVEKTPFLSYKDRKKRWLSIPLDKPLTRREKLFIAEYLKDLDGSAAMRRIGRGGKNPDRRSHDMMLRANVRNAIDSAVAERERACEVSIERLEKEYSNMAFGQYVGPLLASHKLQALDSLAKMKGAFKPETQTVIPVQFVFLGAPPLEEQPSGSSQTAILDLQATKASEE